MMDGMGWYTNASWHVRLPWSPRRNVLGGLRDQTDGNCVGWPKVDPMEEEDPLVPAFAALGLLHLVDNPPAV
jgi:hypothetical protein